MNAMQFSNNYDSLSLCYDADVEALEDTLSANDTQLHTRYMCNGRETNLTECSTDNRLNVDFFCRLVGKVRCQGLCIEF